jgi:Ca2+-binding RTX toxin-like protein
MFERLENRSLLSVQVLPGNYFDVVVQGTSGNDVIVVKAGEGGAVHIDDNGTQYDLTGVTRVSVNGGDGDDLIIGEGKCNSYWFRGGNGNDWLDIAQVDPSTIPNTISGDAGDDILRGSAGSDYIVGGDGYDKAYGGGGVDGGFTVEYTYRTPYRPPTAVFSA